MGTPMPQREPSRPVIDYRDLKFTHNGVYCRVVLRKDIISIGCSDVTITALRRLLIEHEAKFGKPTPEEYVLQG